ncbi:MAG: hypothetical protein EAZ55_06470 [Cytophagales bacterium]|nr:MAG: hypothetical protein EAZ55_06470 [Cytophagales bacterium]
MELAAELLKIVLPAGLVLYGMYLTFKAFASSEIEKIKNERHLKIAEVALKHSEQTLNIRLQAYERLCLFLERISPANIIPRVSNPAMSVGLLQQVLNNEIRQEYNYNLSQQVYISDEAWILIKKATEETILLINNSTVGISEDAPAVELAKKVLENAIQLQLDLTQDAVQKLKSEVRALFEGRMQEA